MNFNVMCPMILDPHLSVSLFSYVSSPQMELKVSGTEPALCFEKV
jgi:hypothetical protein